MSDTFSFSYCAAELAVGVSGIAVSFGDGSPPAAEAPLPAPGRAASAKDLIAASAASVTARNKRGGTIVPLRITKVCQQLNTMRSTAVMLPKLFRHMS